MNFPEFGFTNDKTFHDAAVAWRDAAVADGWSINGAAGSPADQYAELKKDGWVAHACCRTADKTDVGKWKYSAHVHVWGPDGLAVEPIIPYPGFAAMQAGLAHCAYCGADGVETERVGFAGRCCKSCLPEQRKRVEYPGWCD